MANFIISTSFTATMAVHGDAASSNFGTYDSFLLLLDAYERCVCQLYNDMFGLFLSCKLMEWQISSSPLPLQRQWRYMAMPQALTLALMILFYFYWMRMKGACVSSITICLVCFYLVNSWNGKFHHLHYLYSDNGGTWRCR